MTELLLRRITSSSYKGYTIGRLYRKDGVKEIYLCDTLEPENRLARGEAKVMGRTAIPAGRYQVLLTDSPKFSPRKFYAQNGKLLPLINNVPGFEGIRIHAGNYPADTQGCILVGINSEKGAVLNSREAYKKVWKVINLAVSNGESVYITVRNK